MVPDHNFSRSKSSLVTVLMFIFGIIIWDIHGAEFESAHTTNHITNESALPCSGNVIIAAAVNYGFRDVRTFVLSYNNSGSAKSSRLMLLLDESQKEPSTNSGKCLISFLQLFPIEYVFVKSSLHPGNFRFNWILNHLQEKNAQREQYCSVFSTDIRDVYFQGDFNAQMDAYMIHHSIGSAAREDKYVLVTLEGGAHGKALKDCEHHVEAALRPCLTPLIHNLKSFMRHKIICSGSIFGSHDGVLALMAMMMSLMDQLRDPGNNREQCNKQSLTDQMILNLIAYQELPPPPPPSSSLSLAVSSATPLSPNASMTSLSHGLRMHILNNMRSPMFTIGLLSEDEILTSHDRAGPSDILLLTHRGHSLLEPLADHQSPSSSQSQSQARSPPRAGDIAPATHLLAHAAYVHQYDRLHILSKKVRRSVQTSFKQYFGDRGDFMAPFYPPPIETVVSGASRRGDRKGEKRKWRDSRADMKSLGTQAQGLGPPLRVVGEREKVKGLPVPPRNTGRGPPNKGRAEMSSLSAAAGAEAAGGGRGRAAGDSIQRDIESKRGSRGRGDDGEGVTGPPHPDQVAAALEGDTRDSTHGPPPNQGPGQGKGEMEGVGEGSLSAATAMTNTKSPHNQLARGSRERPAKSGHTSSRPTSNSNSNSKKVVRSSAVSSFDERGRGRGQRQPGRGRQDERVKGRGREGKGKGRNF